MADNWIVAQGGQHQTVELTPGGSGFQTVWEVTYTITSGPAQGQSGRVRIPEVMYSAETVKAAIDAAVARANEIAAL